tara:strand:- start:724 stop:1539 length:816 start_codon:yes stop_codon:yes gene_type:complete
MFREFLKSIYYFIYQIFFSKFFLVKFFNSKKILLFNKRNFNYFFQYISNDNDLNTLRQIFIKEEYKFTKNLNKIFKDSYNKILNKKKIPLIIDCGVNICASANYFYLIYPKTEIIGIEPDKINLNLCKKNNLNKKKIKILDSAISNESFNYTVERNNQDGRSSFINNENQKNLKVNSPKTVTMKDIMKNYDLDKYKPFIIKIDIEGHEKNFFSSNTEWMKYFDFIIIELHDWMLPNENISGTFYKALDKDLINYEIFNFGENTLIINRIKI